MDQQNLVRIGFTINLCFDQVGAVFFITLMFVIVKYKNLHNRHCLKLIGIFMFCNLFSKIIIWGPYLTRVIPIVNMPMFVCCGWYIITLTPCVGQLPFSATIAFDRAISVFLPNWYRKQNKKLYLLALCTLGSLYPVYTVVFLGVIAADRPFVPTNCTGDDIFGHYQSIELPLIYATILFYVIMVAKLVINKQERKSYFNRQPLFKSIAFIVAVQVGGWVMTKVAYKYIPAIFFNNAGENDLPLLYYALNCFSSLTITAEFFALYITSSEHRMALKKEFPRLYHYFPDKIFTNKIRAIPNVQQISINVSTRTTKKVGNHSPQHHRA